MVGRADSGSQEDRRTAVCPRRQHHPVSCDCRAVQQANSDRPTPLQYHLRHLRMVPEMHALRSSSYRAVRVGPGYALAPTPVTRHPPEPERTGPVVILHRREAGSGERRDRRRLVLGGLQLRVSRDRQRPRVAVPRSIPEVEVILYADEVREDVVEAPAVVAEARPQVEIGRRPAHGKPGDPRRPADNLAPIERLADPVLIPLGLKAPPVLTVRAPAVMHERGWIRSQVRPRLEKQYRSGAPG